MRASVIKNNTAVLKRKDAAEPSETSVSIFGAPESSPFVPPMKNFWFTTMIAPASKSSISPIATGLPSKKAGSGKFHIMCPIEIYISGTSNMSEAIRRRVTACVSRSGSSALCAFSNETLSSPSSVSASDAP